MCNPTCEQSSCDRLLRTEVDSVVVVYQVTIGLHVCSGEDSPHGVDCAGVDGETPGEEAVEGHIVGMGKLGTTCRSAGTGRKTETAEMGKASKGLDGGGLTLGGSLFESVASPSPPASP